jgi:predicted MPP superfamily phosphohydrolase
MNRRIFLRTLAGASVTTVAAASACAYGEDTHDVEITRVPVQLGLQTPLRVATLGDLHFDPLYDEAYLAHVVSLVSSLQPDLIAYTGDFITNRLGLERVPDLACILARAQAPRGVFAVPGNHEGWTNRVYVQRVIEQRAGIRMLCNETLALPGENNVYLTGLDTFSAGCPRPEVLDQTPADARHIVLAHEPDSFNQLTDARIRLQISGHTHGGQVRVPLYGALVLPTWGRDFQQGLYASGTRQLYVNRGIGTMGCHFRINCRPEITLFELS